MKKLLSLLALACGVLLGQDPLAYITTPVPTDGVTACSNNGVQVLKDTTGTLWACDQRTFVWRKVGASSLPAGTGVLRQDSGTSAFSELSGAVATSASNATVLNVLYRYRVCDIAIGDTSGSAITDGQLGPQSRVCFIPAAATVLEIDVAADGGTPNVIMGRNHAGTIANLVSSTLGTASSGGIACSKVTAATCIGGPTASATLQNTSLAAGDYIEVESGTAGGVAKLMTIHVLYSLN